MSRRYLLITAGLCVLLGVVATAWLWPSAGSKIDRRLTLTDNGKTVSVRVGDRVRLVLDSTWAIGPAPAGGVLHQETSPKITRTSGSCGPTPAKCGSVSVDYTATAAGESSIIAIGNCGEGVIDCPYERDHYQATIAVSP